MSFHSVGFFLPLIIGLLYLRKTSQWASFIDWLLTLIAMGVSWFSITTDVDGLHMVEAYAFVAIFYAVNNQRVPRANHPPAGALVPLFFLSMAIPDVVGAMTYSEGRAATVGGAGLLDGLLLWPIGTAIVYLLLCAISNIPKLNNGTMNQPWRQFLSHHLAP